MKNKKTLFILLISCFLFGCDKPISEGVNITSKGLEYEMYLNERFDKEIFYQNNGQVQASDPSVICVDGTYYMYPTNANNNGDCSYICGYKSTNLTDWTYIDAVFVPNRNAWAIDGLWAPEVIEKDGTYYMYYSGYNQFTRRRGIGVAVSSCPEGPFVEYEGTLKDGTVVDYKTMPIDFEMPVIDPHPFIDDDGKAYLFVSKDQVAGVSSIYGVELEDDMVSIKKETITGPLVQPDQAWENPNGNNKWNEAPFVYKHGGLYYLTYSANYYQSTLYGVGYATSSSPLGTYTKNVNNPILQVSSDWGHVSGTGHNCFFKSPDGNELFISYHSHVDVVAGGGVRKVNFDKVVFDEDGNMIVNGPSVTPQLLPSGSSPYKDITSLATLTSTNTENMEVLNDGIVNYHYDTVEEKEWYSNEKNSITLTFEKNYKVKAIMVYDSADYALAGNTYSLEFSKDKIKKVGFNPLYKYVDDFDWEVKVPGSAGIIQFNNLETSMIKLTFNEEVSISEIVVVGEGD